MINTAIGWCSRFKMVAVKLQDTVVSAHQHWLERKLVLNSDYYWYNSRGHFVCSVPVTFIKKVSIL